MMQSILKHLIILFCCKCCKKSSYSSEQKFTQGSDKVSALLFICPIRHKLSKTTKNLQSLWSSRPTNSQTRTRTLHRSLWNQHQLNAVDWSTNVDYYSKEVIRIKYIHILQMCERAIHFRWSLPSNSFLSFLLWKKRPSE